MSFRKNIKTRLYNLYEYGWWDYRRKPLPKYLKEIDRQWFPIVNSWIRENKNYPNFPKYQTKWRQSKKAIVRDGRVVGYRRGSRDYALVKITKQHPYLYLGFSKGSFDICVHTDFQGETQILTFFDLYPSQAECGGWTDTLLLEPPKVPYKTLQELVDNHQFKYLEEFINNELVTKKWGCLYGDSEDEIYGLWLHEDDPRLQEIYKNGPSENDDFKVYGYKVFKVFPLQ